LLSRVVRIEEDLIDQFFNFSERRLARVLLLFGEITKESKSDSPLKVSQSTLAEMVGTTRPRVSKFMNDFKKKGLVSYNGGLQIHSALVIAFLENRPMSVKKTWATETRNENETNIKATVFRRLSYVRGGCRDAMYSVYGRPASWTAHKPQAFGCRGRGKEKQIRVGVERAQKERIRRDLAGTTQAGTCEAPSGEVGAR
jgi:hypothetical protein